MEKGFKSLACQILDITPRSYSNYSSQGRPIIFLLEKYFKKKDLEEFLSNQEIKKYDDLLQIQKIVIQKNCTSYINTFIQKTISNSLKFSSPDFLDFYFSFLLQFNTFNQSRKFTTILTDFLIDYSQDKDIKLLKSISPYMYLFNDFDELMIIFLSKNVDTNLSILIEEPDTFSNQIKKEEIYFHIIGLYVYRNYSDLKSELKIELIQNIHDIVKEKFFTDELLIDFIIQYVDETL